jgi:hypothetical protein
MTDETDAQVAAIDSAIATCQPLRRNTLAWRLFDSELIYIHASRLLGTIVTDLGFVDLTFREDVARQYIRGRHPVLAEIRLPAGAKVLPMFEVLASDEGDLLIARGSSFLVREVSELEEGGALQVAMELIA